MIDRNIIALPPESAKTSPSLVVVTEDSLNEKKKVEEQIGQEESTDLEKE